MTVGFFTRRGAARRRKRCPAVQYSELVADAGHPQRSAGRSPYVTGRPRAPIRPLKPINRHDTHSRAAFRLDEARMVEGHDLEATPSRRGRRLHGCREHRSRTPCSLAHFPRRRWWSVNESN